MNQDIYEDTENYHRIMSEIGNTSAEEFSERPIKFFIVFSGNGNLTCYDWPVRDNKYIFKTRLHDKPIKHAAIIRGSILITISED